MKTFRMVFVTLCCIVFLQAPVFGADKQLPAPKKDGGPSVLTAIENRASAPGGAFPMGAISDEELATLLWAATGRSQGGKGWTVPTGMGRDPYCSVYVAGPDGVFLYDKAGHTLKQVSAEDIRFQVAKQDFGKKAPYTLIVTADDGILAKLNKEWGPILVGAMTQNLYLAAQSCNIGARYIASFNEEPIRKALKLKMEERPICIMPLGHF